MKKTYFFVLLIAIISCNNKTNNTENNSNIHNYIEIDSTIPPYEILEKEKVIFNNDSSEIFYKAAVLLSKANQDVYYLLKRSVVLICLEEKIIMGDFYDQKDLCIQNRKNNFKWKNDYSNLCYLGYIDASKYKTKWKEKISEDDFVRIIK